MKKYCIYYTTSNGDCKHMMVNATSAKHAVMIAAFTRPASLTLLTGSCWRTRRAEQ